MAIKRGKFIPAVALGTLNIRLTFFFLGVNCQHYVNKLFTGDEDESRGELFEDNDTLALVSTSKKNADFAGSQSRPQ